MFRNFVFPVLLVCCVAACSKETAPPENIAAPAKVEVDEKTAVIERARAPLLDGLGDFNHPITTADPWAQRYFNQGMIMAAGFNHAESIRAFKAAQRLDPNCAMCYWGEALATGPNINVTSKGKAIIMPAERVAAFAAIQKAGELAAGASERERDLIAAQSARYNGDIDTPREPLDLVIARNPRHPLALHLYIHAVEASSRPGRAEDAADELADLVPGSGHLVHMPSHIYWRIGRYFDASEANVRAAKVDEDYIAQCNAQGFYPALYYPHNIHFLWASASMEGRSAIAIEAGRKVAANVRLEQIKEFPTVEFFQTVPLLSLVRFARWDEILQEPQPAAELKYSNAIWRYARSVALSRQGELQQAEDELAAMAPQMKTESVWFLDGNDYPATQILSIAQHLATGELAQARGDYVGAIEAFSAAVEAQDLLPYTEPPFWYYPTRQSLGHSMLRAEDYTGAEAVYRADLAQYPRNGWSIFGLYLSLEAQGRAEEAAAAKQRFENIWGRADVSLTSSIL